MTIEATFTPDGQYVVAGRFFLHLLMVKIINMHTITITFQILLLTILRGPYLEYVLPPSNQ